MCARAFIFSLDAFVAFVLMAAVISFMIFASGTPKAAYTSLEQAHQLAQDTLEALATTSDLPGGSNRLTYLEQIISNRADAERIMLRVAGGNPQYNGIIPRGYGYRLETYDFNGTNWTVYFDSAHPLSSYSDRANKTYTKLQASATRILSLYDVMPDPGASPYCYLSCSGNGLDSTKVCNATPCDAPKSVFIEGESKIQFIRLVVYT
ncbi:MAG: hypothetical protein NT051_01675 [Candidatus Micrarchaeota archaeon]|nr:hypothetical protein [Candidatus Micrarchaeota archaeon]